MKLTLRTARTIDVVGRHVQSAGVIKATILMAAALVVFRVTSNLPIVNHHLENYQFGVLCVCLPASP